MVTTFQNYERVNYGGGVRYRDAKTGKSLTQDEYERLWMRENNVRPQFVVAPKSARNTAEVNVGRKEGLAGLKGLFTGDDFESRLKRAILTMGLSEEKGRKIYSDMIGNAAILSTGSGGIVVAAAKFGALKFGTEMLTHGDVLEAGGEALGEAGAITALGALGPLGKAGAAVVRSPTGRKIAAVLGTAVHGAGAVSQVPMQTEEEREATLDWHQIMTDIQSSANPVPVAASAPLETVVRVRQAAKAGGADRFANSRNFLATDKVPDTIFGIPIVAKREDYTEEDIVFFQEHPEAGGYYDMGEGTPEDGTAEGAPVQADVPVRGSDMAAFLAKTAADAYMVDNKAKRAGIPRMYAYENRLHSMGRGSVAAPPISYKCNLFVANVFNSGGVVRWPVGNGTTPPRAGDIHVHSKNVPDYLVRDDSAVPAEGMLITRDYSGEPGSYRHVGIIGRSPYGAEGLGVFHASQSSGGLEWTPLDEFKSVEAKEYGLHRIDPVKYDAYMKRMEKGDK